MKYTILSAALALSLSLGGQALAGDMAHADQGHGDAHAQAAPAAPHWSYEGETGASHWAGLDPSYEACATGHMQSPINIDSFSQKGQEALGFSYQPANAMNIANNGHTIQVNFNPGNELSVGGKTYELKQLHFHTPSEHYIDGAPYAMEMHLVHKAADGQLAVVGVMMEVGGEGHNQNLEKVWQNAPIVEGANLAEGVEFSPASLLPASSSYFNYSGSLTTPPCTEGVSWFVMQDPIQISAGQLTAFQRLFPVNARMIQPLNGRTVTGF